MIASKCYNTLIPESSIKFDIMKFEESIMYFEEIKVRLNKLHCNNKNFIYHKTLRLGVK